MIQMLENRWFVVMVGFRKLNDLFAGKPPHYICFELSYGFSAIGQSRARIEVVSGPHDTKAEAEAAMAKVVTSMEQPPDAVCATACISMFGLMYRRCKAADKESDGVADGYCGPSVCASCKESDKDAPTCPDEKQSPLFNVVTHAMARRLKHNYDVTDDLCEKLAGRMTPRKLRRALLDGVAAGIKESDALRYADILGSKLCVVDATLPEGRRVEEAVKALDVADAKVGFVAGSLSTRIADAANVAPRRAQPIPVEDIPPTDLSSPVI